MFKKGDLIKNVDTGDVLTLSKTDGDFLCFLVPYHSKIISTVSMEQRYVNVRWHKDSCQVFQHNHKVSSHLPDDEDYDKHGRVLAAYEDGESAFFTKEELNDGCEGIAWWCRTPDWKPRKPLPIYCGKCEHGKTSSYNGGDEWCDVCFKYKKVSTRWNGEPKIKPFYTEDGKPCNED